MHTRYRTEAIFLKKIKRFEADEYLIAYSRDFGKLFVAGKSIRKIKSKLRSSSELFCYSNIEFVRGRNYNILTDSETINNFSKIKNDLGKMSVAFKISELIDSFITEEEEDENLWALIKKSFYLLDGLSNKGDKKEELKLFYFYFAFKFLEFLGYAPKVDSCIIDNDEKVGFFSPWHGGAICPGCKEKVDNRPLIKFSEKDKKFLLLIFKTRFEDFLSQKANFKRAEEILEKYIQFLPRRI